MIKYKFTEADKTSKIQKHPNLSDEQKEELIEFFKTHTDQHNLIDWNRFNEMTYEEIHTIIETWERTHLLPKDKLEDLKEGVDYEYLGENNNYKYYFIYTYKASVAFASNNIGPEVWTPLIDWYIKNSAGEKTNWEQNVLYDYPPKDINDMSSTAVYGGAKWCISMNHTQRFWKEYILDGVSFVFVIGDMNSSYEHIADCKYAIELRDTQIEDMFDAWDNNNVGIRGNKTAEFILEPEIKEKLKSCLSKFKEIVETEIIKKNASNFKERTKGLEIKSFTYKGYNFPMVKMGTRPEGKVFGSYYLLTDDVPFSPKFKYAYDSYANSDWSISIIRQWLNSDEPAGQWFKEYPYKGHIIDWESTPDYTKDFIKNTDGFLKIIGINKSQLTPVKNITTNVDGKKVTTEDYVWIPSLTEWAIQSNDDGSSRYLSYYSDGSPLDYWENLVGEDATFAPLDMDKRILYSCNTKDVNTYWYWTRTGERNNENKIICVSGFGVITWANAHFKGKTPVLMCFKE